jgi:hypothetical protein
MTRKFAIIFVIGLVVSSFAAPQPSFAQQKPKSAIDCPTQCFHYCEKNATPGGRGKTNCQISCSRLCEMDKAGMK